MADRRITHGMTNSTEWLAWRGMKGRCLYACHKSFGDYGGRGITICERWLTSFAAFFADMGPAPSKSHTLARKDPNGHYEPAEWARRGHLAPSVIYSRVRRGWDHARAVSQPSRQRRAA